jgi:hypothetical protein
MSHFRLAVERALVGVGPFPRSVAESILEIAYLTMAVDEDLRDEEIEAFSVIAAAMLQPNRGAGEALDDAALRDWLDKFAGELDRAGIQDRLEAAVKSLGDNHPAKLAAYRAACLMAMSDLDAHDREFEFDLQLIATLGVSQEEADAIVDEVNQAVTPPEVN